MYFLVSIMTQKDIVVHTSVCTAVSVPYISSFTCVGESLSEVYEEYREDGQIISICEIDRELYEKYDSCVIEFEE